MFKPFWLASAVLTAKVQPCVNASKDHALPGKLLRSCLPFACPNRSKCFLGRSTRQLESHPNNISWLMAHACSNTACGRRRQTKRCQIQTTHQHVGRNQIIHLTLFQQVLFSNNSPALIHRSNNCAIHSFPLWSLIRGRKCSPLLVFSFFFLATGQNPSTHGLRVSRLIRAAAPWKANKMS